MEILRLYLRVSSTDLAENVLLKAQEYLESGGEEVWLVFPESKWVNDIY